MIRRRFVLVVPFLLGVLPVAAAEAPAPAEARANVSFTLTVGRVGGPGGAKERSYKFVGQDGSVSRMLVGFRTPLPTRTSDEAKGDSTAYIYQNVGVTADLDARSIDGGKFLVSGQVEISGAREGAPAESAPGGKPPMIGTFQQELHVVVANGKKIRIAEGPDPESGMLYVDLRVDRLE